LKVAPEHVDRRSAPNKMKKPNIEDFRVLSCASFGANRRRVGKEQSTCCALLHRVASGSDMHAMIDLAVVPQAQRLQARTQVQDFIPAPFDVATTMYYTGVDPMTKPSRCTWRRRDQASGSTTGADAILEAGALL
jgi:hypothetical protein